MPLYRSLAPLTYTAGNNRVINITRANVIFSAPSYQVANIDEELFELVGDGNNVLAERATFMVFNSLADLPLYGSPHHLYLDHFTGQVYRWSEVDRAYNEVVGEETILASASGYITENAAALAPEWVEVDPGPPRLWQQYIAHTDEFIGEPVDYLPDVTVEVTEKIDEIAPPAVAAILADKWVDLEAEDDWAAADIGPMGEFWHGVHADGTHEFSATTFGEGVYTRSLEVEDVAWAAGDFPDGTYGEVHMDVNGQIQPWACRNIVARGGGAGSVGTVHVLIGMGQSNMSGRGLPISSELDPPNPRIFQFGAHASEITTATVPLDMVDVPAGISPLTLIAREYLKRLPPGDVILLIPAAKGSSQLGASTGDYTNGVWNVNYTGESVNLYGLAKTQISTALAKAAEKWPIAEIRKVCMFWHQGESNATTSQAVYASRFDALVADLRTYLSAPNLPVVVGGMVPEWVAATAGLENIVAAHVDTPKRLAHTGYAYPPLNGGGSQSLNSNEIVHFSRQGLEPLSANMLLALDRALRNVTTSIPNPPVTVSATINGTTLTVNWSQPMCRYTAFTPEFSENGGEWTAISHSTVDTTATATIAAFPVRVRVSTTNEVGTSATSTPAYATIIKEP